jgi:hypothetical protein
MGKNDAARMRKVCTVIAVRHFIILRVPECWNTQLAIEMRNATSVEFTGVIKLQRNMQPASAAPEK